VVWACGLGWLFASVPGEERGRWVGIAFGAGTLGTVAGPLVGVLADAVGIEAAFVGVAAASLALALVTVVVEAPEVEAARQTARSLLALLGGGEVRRAATLVAFQSTLFAMLVTFVPVLLVRNGSSGVVAPAFLASAVVALAVNPLVGVVADRRGAEAMVRLGLLLAPPLLICLGLVESVWAIVALTIAYFGIVWNLIEVSAVTSLTSATERRGGGVAGSVLAMVTIAAGELLGALAAGGLGSALGHGPTFFLGAVALAAIGFTQWRERPSD
jgi:predicted MFS family arabinose efflux permease